MSNQQVFGRVRMGYGVIESERFDQWRTFMVEGLGIHLAHQDNETMSFRIDDYAKRFVVVKGKLEDFSAIGWQVDDDAVLKEILRRLESRGAEPVELSPEQAELRGIEHGWRVVGPKGLAVELFTKAYTTDEPLTMLAREGFNTGECGLGHVALTSRRPEEAIAFWEDVFDARLSDTIEETISGVKLDITFLRLNPRHHSIAVASTRGLRLDPIGTRVQHLNIEGRSHDDLTAAYQRCKALGFRMAMGVGQHPNDREVSFYVESPSGFQMEFGWNPIHVDESTWEPTRYQQISVWGHKPEDLTVMDKLGEFGRGLKSLTRKEVGPFEEKSS